MNEKLEMYGVVRKEISAVLAGETHQISKMATISCMLSNAFPTFFWTGFYLVDPEKPDELVVGPYQGTLGCLRIPFGRGVCGKVAEKRETIIVDNVHDFDGHIACDASTVSEIVVPVFDAGGNLIAVLDIDSTDPAAFDKTDQHSLETLTADIFAR